ncbi:carboxymuconolactone decarboxylase family protein [Lolliginicoccus suaedae]|uniref:carboxymuconolactone decarboxylase family protein n=1 Tax=Lolliginicoccus suaedae TaxID=2605429 RepID=UPI0011EEDFD4|nr:carboxymuconolactone decarboxylase family protein [Lolliginicoccus suaedae]
MPRLPVHTTETAPAATTETLQHYAEMFGKVLNIYGEMAHVPIVLDVYHSIQQNITRSGTFDADVKEAIALAVGAVDDCAYCQSAHTGGATQAGWSTDQTIAIRAGETTGSTKIDALLAVAREIAGNIGVVEETTWEAAREAGWSDQELGELFVHVILNLYTNYFNHYVGTELDIPKASGL